MAVDRYVDKVLGSDGGTGEIGDPWETINKVQTTLTGDQSDSTVNLKRGDGQIWRETYYVAGYGTSGHPFVHTSYGSGDLPKIYGSAKVSTWEYYDTNKYRASYASSPDLVFFINADDSIKWGNEVANIGSLVSEYDWVWDSNYLYCFAATDPDDRYNSIEATVRNICISIDTLDYIDFEHLDVAFSVTHGFWSLKSDYITIDSNIVHHVGIKNASEAEGILLEKTYYNLASNNTVHDVGNHGIMVVACNSIAGGQNTVEYNEIYDCYHSGIDAQCLSGDLDDTIIRYNLWYLTPEYDTSYETAGIHTEAQSGYTIDNTEIYYNVLYNIGEHGIHIGARSAGVNIYNNVICGTLSGIASSDGIDIASSTSSNINIKNNIVVDILTNCFLVESSSPISSCDYNCWYNSVSVNNYVYVVGVGTYGVGDFDDYKTDTGFDIHGVWEDPKFIDKTNHNFQLQIISPCLNAGINVGLTQDYIGNTVPLGSGVDMGAYEMGGVASDYLENAFLKHVFKVAQMSVPGNLYVALCKSTVEDDDTGSTLPSEVSGGGYARKRCNTWTTPSANTLSNNIGLSFGDASAPWGTITDYAICDHSTTGNMLICGKFSPPRHIGTGDGFHVATNDLDVMME